MMNTISVLMACALGASSPAKAQVQATPHRWDSDVCADTTVAAPYTRCALFLEGDHLWRGLGSEVVMVADPMKPLALTRMVRGDTARRLAHRYERAWTVGGTMQFIGSAMVLGSFIATKTHMVSVTGPAPERKLNKPLAAVVFTGVGLIVAGEGVKWWSVGQGQEALEIFNRGLKR
jgi:hypothetical protein